MLRRSAFKQERPERVRSATIPSTTGHRARMSAVNDEVVSVPKDARSMQSHTDEDRLYRHVASLPCALCWREGRTQVSHSNQIIDGKGRGLKAYPWRIAALCVECHAAIDQGRDLKKTERTERWDKAHRWTLGELFARGLVRPV